MNNRGPRGMHGRGMPGKGMPPVAKGTFKRVLGYLWRFRVRFLFVILFILLDTFASLYGTLFLGSVVDDYITPMLKTGQDLMPELLKALLSTGLILLIGVVSGYMFNRLQVTISQRILKEIRDDMFAGMQKLPIRYFDTNTHGDIMSRYTNDTDTLRQLIAQTIPNFASSLITVVSTFITMLLTSGWLTLLVICCVVLVMFLTKSIGSGSATYFVRQQKSIGKVNGFIEEMLSGQKVIKVFCHEETSKEDFDKLNDNLCEEATKANTYANILMPIMNNAGNIMYVAIAVIGGAIAIYTNEAVLTIGAIVIFLQLSRRFLMPINQLSQQMGAIAMALAGADRIFKLMDEKPEVDDGYVTLVNARMENGEIVETAERTGMWAWKHPHEDGTTTYTQLAGDVVLDMVDFAYEENKPVLHDISLYAKPGQKVAFVGATGAGKTTITNLINRFYDIADGKIRYDGININKIKKADLRRSLGIVLQDTNLFTGTVMENIRYGKLDATDEEVYAAAKLANAHDFITRLPQGYDTMLTGNGANLSQGQRQLLSIARAAVADPPVMILDEATSSIDTRTEMLVQRGMDSLMKGRTTFVIAHRLSTVRNSDVIMVLDHGRIIERGSHEELIAQKGKYYQLYTGAFELE